MTKKGRKKSHSTEKTWPRKVRLWRCCKRKGSESIVGSTSDIAAAVVVVVSLFELDELEEVTWTFVAIAAAAVVVGSISSALLAVLLLL